MTIVLEVGSVLLGQSSICVPVCTVPRLGLGDRIACTPIVPGSDFSFSSFCSIILFLILKHMAEAGGSNLKIFTDTHMHRRVVAEIS